MKTFAFIGLLVLFTTQPLRAAEQDELPQFTEQFAEMRDTTRLAANVFVPQGQGPWPVIVTRTPYLKDSERWMMGAEKYLNAGYVYVVQDVRGKGHSQGYYIPFNDDLADGYDTVEWLARQPWSNGRVGITGGSAMGIAANMAAAADPPHLVAAYVVVAPASRFITTFINGVFKDKDTGGWLRNQGSEDAADALQKRVTWDSFWQVSDTAGLRRNVDIPMFNVGGWYDIFSVGTLDNFTYLQNHGRPGARGNQKLLMGPFGHGPLSGDLEYPGTDRNSAVDNEIRWFDYWLKGIDNGIMDEPPVDYFMMAAARKGDYSPQNRWIKSANWPPAHRPVRYHLDENRRLTKRQPFADKGSIPYPFDPDNPVTTVGGANLTFERGPMDQRAIMIREDYLRFESELLETDVAIAGPVHVELWASTDGPDTDFMVKLIDVYPDGYEALILDAPIRARYRAGRDPDAVKMMLPGVPDLFDIDLWSTAITFEKGHRIALHVSSSNSPRFDVNRNNGDEPGESNLPARIANNHIYFGKQMPSALVLPVIYPVRSASDLSHSNGVDTQ